MGRYKKLYCLSARRLLRETKIFWEYFSILENLQNQMTVIAVKDTIGLEFTEEMNRQIAKIGGGEYLVGKHWHGYIIVINNGKVIYEKLGRLDEAIEKDLEISPGLELCIASKPLNAGNDVEIIINGKDHAVKRRGFNIVVYDVKEKYVIDSVCFDTHDRSLTAYREKQSGTGINVIAAESPIISEYKKRLNIRMLLPKAYQRIIRVRMIWAWGSYFFNIWKSIINAFRTDKYFDVKVIIYGPHDKLERENILRENNCEFVFMEQYNVSMDRPDILIIAPTFDWNIYDRKDLEDFQEYSRLMIAIPMTLVKFRSRPMSEHLNLLMNDASKNIDYFVFDKLIYQEAAAENLVNERMVEIGNPKFDEIYDFMQSKKALPCNWEKFKGKKIVLWTTDHVFENDNVSVDLYMADVLRYFESHPDLALIFRPHPMLPVELTESGIWAEADVGEIKKYMERTPNMVWDDLPEYAPAYSAADAIITDPNCGISISALATQKPLAVFFRNDGRKCMPAHPQVVEALYCLNNVQEGYRFFDMIAEGEDPKKGKRKEALYQYVSHFDGKNGQRIKDFIMEKYHEMPQ